MLLVVERETLVGYVHLTESSMSLEGALVEPSRDVLAMTLGESACLISRRILASLLKLCEVEHDLLCLGTNAAPLTLSVARSASHRFAIRVCLTPALTCLLLVRGWVKSIEHRCLLYLDSIEGCRQRSVDRRGNRLGALELVLDQPSLFAQRAHSIVLGIVEQRLYVNQRESELAPNEYLLQASQVLARVQPVAGIRASARM